MMIIKLSNNKFYDTGAQTISGLLASSGCSFIERDNGISINFDDVEGFERTDLHKYLDPFRISGSLPAKENASFNQIDITFHEDKSMDFIEAASLIADIAIDSSDALSEKFERRVKLVSEEISPPAHVNQAQILLQEYNVRI